MMSDRTGETMRVLQSLKKKGILDWTTDGTIILLNRDETHNTNGIINSTDNQQSQQIE